MTWHCSSSFIIQFNAFQRPVIPLATTFITFNVSHPKIRLLMAAKGLLLNHRNFLHKVFHLSVWQMDRCVPLTWNLQSDATSLPSGVFSTHCWLPHHCTLHGRARLTAESNAKYLGHLSASTVIPESTEDLCLSVLFHECRTERTN